MLKSSSFHSSPSLTRVQVAVFLSVRSVCSAMVVPVTVAVFPVTLAFGPWTNLMFRKVSNWLLQTACVVAWLALKSSERRP